MARRRRGGLQPLGDILERSLRKINLEVSSESGRLQRAWRKAAGPRIAAHTAARRLRNGALFVSVGSAPWLHQLQYLKEDLLSKVAAVLGPQAVREIRFSLGEIPQRLSPPLPAAPAPSPTVLRERDRRIIDESVASIADEELREILRRIMVRDAVRRRRPQGWHP